MRYHPYRGHSALFYPVEIPVRPFGQHWTVRELIAMVEQALRREFELIIFGRHG